MQRNAKATKKTKQTKMWIPYKGTDIALVCKKL